MCRASSGAFSFRNYICVILPVVCQLYSGLAVTVLR